MVRCDRHHAPHTVMDDDECEYPKYLAGLQIIVTTPEEEAAALYVPPSPPVVVPEPLTLVMDGPDLPPESPGLLTKMIGVLRSPTNRKR